MTERARPGSAVLDAFGASAPLVALSGGQGTSWRSGGVVLKPLDSDGETIEWLEGVLADTIQSDRVRWTRPIRSRAGDLVVEGWTAWEHVAGEHFDQYLIRALLFRIVSDHLRDVSAGARSQDPYARVVEAVRPVAD